jgi:hypothetical protein
MIIKLIVCIQILSEDQIAFERTIYSYSSMTDIYMKIKCKEKNKMRLLKYKKMN